ncbi:MAG: hypothetical protein NZ651_00105 [Candidatus Bipolaricaulota bacterium]|nr:hypothetical protein [Candidatus Bipolaricaulota bacterium]MDW8126173.1 hypothetical protein [Candidatus Bipolaricaulota bacterium]
MKILLGMELAVFLSLVVGGQPMPVVEIEGGLRHEFFVEPGRTYSGEIVVRSKSEGVVTVNVSIRDFLMYADGRVAYAEPGTNPRTNAGWLEVFPKQFTLGPGEETVVRYRINVPADPMLRGSYWCVILITPAAPAPPLAGAGEIVVGVVQIVQYAVLVITDIAGALGACNLRLSNARVNRTEEGLVFQVDLENTGERRLRPVVYLELYSTEGENLGRFAVETQRTILPGCSVRQTIALPLLKPGTYPALLIVDNLDECVWGAQVTLEAR